MTDAFKIFWANVKACADRHPGIINAFTGNGDEPASERLFVVSLDCGVGHLPPS